MRFEGVVVLGLLQVVEKGFSEEHLVLLGTLQLEDIFGKLPNGILDISPVVVQGLGELRDIQGVVQPLCLENFMLDLVLAFIESVLSKLDYLVLKSNQVKGSLISFLSPNTVDCLFTRICSLFSIS